jgi:hypothetical protein
VAQGDLSRINRVGTTARVRNESRVEPEVMLKKA